MCCSMYLSIASNRLLTSACIVGIVADLDARGCGPSAGAQRCQVAAADGETVERVAAAFVLLDDQPPNLRLAAGGQHVLPVEVALTHLRHHRLPLADVHVLEVNQWHPSAQPANPACGAAATVLDPVGVDLGVEEHGIARPVQNLEASLLSEVLELEAVVVVAEPDTG